jgi:hypothetical protein
MNEQEQEQRKAAWTKCPWCDKRTLLYYDETDGHYHFTAHDWRPGERCANSHKTVYNSEVEP